ncbi:heterokaryon incompatibility protein-domain-containing protein [Podospora fimiseda]|uniref:Heterokaryon incompatibility protein-domain-containing protein n=1 Tax=Podospora fimiseda TaxID=252190 RepID=A0AAN7GWB6_9PEZI|nr:heterokaryon incompatibility protein-domain-containing protein [Podospora fimiseda]
MRRESEYREPLFTELFISIPTTLLLCLAMPLLISIHLFHTIWQITYNTRTLIPESTKFLHFCFNYQITCWIELFCDFKILTIKSIRLLFSNPPKLLLQPQRKPKMPRLSPKKKFFPYKYNPLSSSTDTIRLFIIPPADDIETSSSSNEITGTLQTINLLTEPPYTALSYSWGSPSGNYSRSCRITISPGTPQEGIIFVTQTCAKAINSLRLPKKPRAVWIDAICINQDDLTERSHQVSIMAKIYTSATQVVAYTGSGDRKTDQSFDHLNSLDEKEINVPSPRLPSQKDWIVGLKGNRKQPMSWIKDRFSRRQHISSDIESQMPDYIVGLATNFFQQRYFTRVWTLQETLLPSIDRTSLICGNKSTSASRALHVLSILQASTKDGISIPTDLGQIFTLVRKRAIQPEPYKSHLLDILLATRNRNATDPRDRIFGVLSIAWGMDFPLTFAELYKIDYSLGCNKVYAEYSEKFILHYGVGFWLGLLGFRAWDLVSDSEDEDRDGSVYCGSGSDSEDEVEDKGYLPSWAADWGKAIPFAGTGLARTVINWSQMVWVNEEVLKGENRDFVAAERRVKGDEGGNGVRFEDLEGKRVMVLEGKRRLKKGWIFKNVYGWDYGKEKGEGEVDGNDVLVEIYRGLVVLLKQEEKKGYYRVVQCCAHALTEVAARELSKRWGKVVIDGEGWQGEWEGYLGEIETFKII